MTECDSEVQYNFESPRPLVVQFSDLELSSDAGILLARQAEAQLGICQALAECIPEWRDPNKITHSLSQLISQRVFQLVGGYEDVVDSNTLRHDPIYKLACGRLPLNQAEFLASQPTLSRLENRVGKSEIAAMRGKLLEGFIQRHRVAPAELVLDIDGWDAATHGQQQLSCFHGYFGQHMYFPVLINDSNSGYPLVLQLRAGNSHPGKGIAGILRWLFWRLRRVWPQVKLTLRADAGFALPEILRLCERSGVGYVIGFARNPVLEHKIADLLERARLQGIQRQQKVRLFDDVYYAAGTWTAPRRLVMKAEWLPKGPNPRFLLTNLDAPAQAIYDQLYVQRGSQSEHRIKELKLGLNADRLSCHRFVANQFRLLLSQAAYILLLALRQAASGTSLATAQVERLRCVLIKGAARVRVSARRVLVELATYCPFAAEIRLIAHRLCTTGSLKFS